MPSDTQKIQTTLDKATYEALQKLAEDNRTTLSKAAAKMIEQGIASQKNQAAQMKIEGMLKQVLASVYDFEMVKRNHSEVKDLLANIDKSIEEKLNN